MESQGARSVLLAALIAAFAGLFAAGVLSLGYILKLPVPCGGSAGCGTVAQHPSSSIFGIRIAYLGVGAYGMIIGLLLRGARAPGARMAVAVVTGIGLVISAALLVYSRMVIGATCWWCVGSGAAMLTVFVLSVLLARRRDAVLALRPAWVWCLAFLTAIGLGLQAGGMQRAANRPPVPAERLALVQAQDLLDPAKSVGPADAPVTVVVFADFHCPACRMVHASLHEFQRNHPQSVRVVFRHLPFWQIRGHEFSRAAAALSEMAGERGLFWRFADAVYATPRAWQREDYLALMNELGFAPDEVEARLQAPDEPAVARVLRDEALAERLGIQQTPTFILLVQGLRPISANQRTLTRLLNSPEIRARLEAGKGPHS